MSRPRLAPCSVLLCVLLCVLSACAHGAERPCPSTSAAPSASTGPEGAASLPWVDARSLAAAREALTLYDARWLVLTGESGAYAPVPHTLHNFTLGRWECALGAEQASDELSQGIARIERTRRVVCTHPTGVVAQTELSCSWQSPSPIRAGSPSEARREVHLTLSDAPSVSVSCEPEPKERLPLYQGEHVRTAEACILNGKVETCPAVTY